MKEIDIGVIIVAIPTILLVYALSRVKNVLWGVIFNSGFIGVLVVLIVIGATIYKKYYE